jgi:hypothetical protein
LNLRSFRAVALAVAAVLLASVALAACGDSGSSSTATTPTARLGDSLVAPPDPPTVGRYSGPASDNRTVSFTYKDGKVTDFGMGNGLHFKTTDVTQPTARAPHYAFLVRGAHSLEWKGTWSEYGTWVEGTYQYKDSGGYIKTTTWKANALDG